MTDQTIKKCLICSAEALAGTTNPPKDAPIPPDKQLTNTTVEIILGVESLENHFMANALGELKIKI